jgi:DNA-binding protein HU-beta
MAKKPAPDQTAQPAPPTKEAGPVVVTLKQLAITIAGKQGLAVKPVSEALAALVGEVVSHLKAGNRVRISQIGILEVKNRPARTVRNPATGQPMEVGESKKIAFRVAKELKEAV